MSGLCWLKGVEQASSLWRVRRLSIGKTWSRISFERFQAQRFSEFRFALELFLEGMCCRDLRLLDTQSLDNVMVLLVMN